MNSAVNGVGVNEGSESIGIEICPASVVGKGKGARGLGTQKTVLHGLLPGVEVLRKGD